MFWPKHSLNFDASKFKFIIRKGNKPEQFENIEYLQKEVPNFGTVFNSSQNILYFTHRDRVYLTHGRRTDSTPNDKFLVGEMLFGYKTLIVNDLYCQVEFNGAAYYSLSGYIQYYPHSWSECLDIDL